MAIKTSINKLRDTQSNLDSIVKSIYSSITSNRAVVADAIRIAKDCIYKYQQAIHDYEKDINYAKK
jgi:pyoverdine/dityrosine biosynthesis protein Dit1